MRLVYFTHSLVSCWNHGNAHFQRGLLRELVHRGHDVRVFEPADGWSRSNLLRDHGTAPIRAFTSDFPELSSACYAPDDDVAAMVDGADVVLVHEWNDPALVATVGRARRRADFLLLFHDTHHRAATDPAAICRFELGDYDGVLAFGESLAEIYRRWGWGARAFVLHEAADTRLFRPMRSDQRRGLVWIGNWGDGERGAELETFLFRPAAAAELRLTVHGVRYPEPLPDVFAGYAARYAGWLPNARAPEVLSRHLITTHVPRRVYARALPGIPTIRVFEALACGIPLVCAPWDDCEGLFGPDDYLRARSEAEMTGHLRALAQDRGLRERLAAQGLETIRRRHTCAHRADELLAIVRRMKAAGALEVA